MYIKNLFKLITIAMFAITIFACSDGGGGGDEDRSITPINDTDVRTGVFLDGPVIGLGYRSRGEQGTTDRDGSFSYVHGADVTFFIGDIVIGTGRGQTVMTPLDLVPGDVDETNSTVTNIIRLLQTLDYDGEPSNGIEIVDNVRNAAVNGVFAFIDVTEPAHLFDRNTNVINGVRQLTAFNLTGPRGLVSVDVARAHFSVVLIDLGLKEPPETTQTCPNGNVIPVSATCPPADVQLCPDGTTIAAGETCPTPTTTCPNGNVVLVGQVCPIDTQTCPNGSVIPADQQCPAETKTCSDGSVVLVTDACPTPSNTDAAGHTSDDVLSWYSGSFAGFMYDNSDNGVTYGSWNILFRTTNNVSMNSETNLWNLDVVGTVVGVDNVPGCGYESTMFGYISSTGVLDIALECNSLVWVEAQFSNNRYAAQGPVYMLNGSRQQIGKFNGGHNDWAVDVNGVSKTGLGQTMRAFDGLFGTIRATDTNNNIPGTLNGIIFLPWWSSAEFHSTYSFINFNGEYINLEINNFEFLNSEYQNSYWGFAISPSTTPSLPSITRSRVVVLAKSNGDIVLYSPFDSQDTSSYTTPTVTMHERYYRNNNITYGYAGSGRTGSITSTSFFGLGERFEGIVNIFNYFNPDLEVM